MKKNSKIKNNNNFLKNILSICICILFFAIELYIFNTNITFNNIFISNDIAIDNNIAIESKNENIDNTSTIESEKEDIENIDNNGIINDIEKEMSEVIDNDSTKIINENSNSNEEKIPKVVEVDESYFENALFIGDSRLEGFYIYKKLEGATYFVSRSMGVFTGFDTEYNIPEYGFITLEELLSIKKFDKIYISLGINNVGAGIERHRKMYIEFLNRVIAKQPDAIIFLLANLRVTEKHSNSGLISNDKINEINYFIESFADYYKIFYIDPNFLYDDGKGNLDKAYSSDDVHIYIHCYDKYLLFLKYYGIIYE